MGHVDLSQWSTFLCHIPSKIKDIPPILPLPGPNPPTHYHSHYTLPTSFLPTSGVSKCLIRHKNIIFSFIIKPEVMAFGPCVLFCFFPEAFRFSRHNQSSGLDGGTLIHRFECLWSFLSVGVPEAEYQWVTQAQCTSILHKKLTVKMKSHWFGFNYSSD